MNKKLPSRQLLILDEAHMLETEIVKFREIAITRRKWRKYIPNLRIDNHGYDVDGWVDFLDKLRDMMLDIKIPVENKELLIEAKEDIEKLELTIDSISLSPDNWICFGNKIGRTRSCKGRIKASRCFTFLQIGIHEMQ